MTNARLYFFYQPGCPACMAAEPQLNKFITKNSASGLMVMRLNAQRRAGILDYEPEGTPAYQFVVDEGTAWTHEGYLPAEHLQKVWDAIRNGTPPEDLGDEDDEDAVPRRRKVGKETTKDEPAKDEEE